MANTVELLEDKVDDFDGNMMMMRIEFEGTIAKLDGRVISLEQNFKQKLQDDIFSQLDVDGAYHAFFMSFCRLDSTIRRRLCCVVDTQHRVQIIRSL